MMDAQTGAAVLLSALARAGVSVCLANPGTTELGLVNALDDVPAVRPVLGLFEGVCTGAADGYARISGKPALTLLHLGPGLANGVANLHNARRARSAIINIVGDHASWHLAADSPLTSDIESLAGTVSRAVIRLQRGAAMLAQIEEAVRMAQEPPGHIVTLIAPSDFMDEPLAGAVPGSAATHARVAREPSALEAGCVDAGAADSGGVDTGAIDAAARQLLAAEGSILLLGGWALSERGQRAAARIADACGSRLLMECYPSHVDVGGGLPRLERLAYFPQDVRAQLGSARLLLADAKVPVSYFGYAGQPSVLVSDEQLIPFYFSSAQVVNALEALAVRLAAAAPRGRFVLAEPPAAAFQPRLTPVDAAEVLCDLIPERAVVSLEGSTCGSPYLQRAWRAPRHTIMTNTGGAIGQGLPCAIGAAIARPGAKVVCLQSDGSAQYTIQSLWTMARERLDVVVLIAANHRYGILQVELTRSGSGTERPAADHLTRIASPAIDWVSLAKGYGVAAVAVSTREALQRELSRLLASPGPALISMELA